MSGAAQERDFGEVADSHLAAVTTPVPEISAACIQFCPAVGRCITSAIMRGENPSVAARAFRAEHNGCRGPVEATLDRSKAPVGQQFRAPVDVRGIDSMGNIRLGVCAADAEAIRPPKAIKIAQVSHRNGTAEKKS